MSCELVSVSVPLSIRGACAPNEFGHGVTVEIINRCCDDEEGWKGTEPKL